MRDPSLFQPTLTAADDAVGFRRPWRPMGLAILAAFFGILAGGLLLGLNEPRLGRPERRWAVLGIVVGLFVLQVAGIYTAALSGWLDISERGDRRLANLLQRIVAGVAAVAIAQTQRRRYQLFEQTGEPGGALLLPAVGSVALAILAELLTLTPLAILSGNLSPR